MNTKGWDVIYAIKTHVASADMQRNMSQLVTKFDWQWVSQSGGKQIAVSFTGEFDPWSICNQGSQQYIQLDMPVQSGNYAMAVGGKTVKQVDMSGMVLRMQFDLKFIDQANATGKQQLVFHVEKSGSLSDADQNGAVICLDVFPAPDYQSNSDSSRTQQGDGDVGPIIKHSAAALFLQHKDQLDYAFATIDLVPPGATSWMAPQKMAFAFWSPAGGAEGLLAIFTKVTDWPDANVAQLSRELDSSLLSNDHDVFVAVSQKMWLTHLLLPSLPTTYKYTAVNHDGGMEIGSLTNNGNIPMGNFKWGLITYSPVITAYSMTVSDNQLKQSASGTCDLQYLDSWMGFSLSATNTFGFAGETISFPCTASSSSHSNHVSAGGWIIGILGGGIGLGVLAACSEGIGAASGDYAAGIISKQIKAMNVKNVTWGQSLPDLTVDNAVLSQAMYFQCKA